MVEIHAAAPPHLINLACDVRQRPSLGLLLLGLLVLEAGLNGREHGGVGSGVNDFIEGVNRDDLHELGIESVQLDEVSEEDPADGDRLVAEDGIIPFVFGWSTAALLVVA